MPKKKNVKIKNLKLNLHPGFTLIELLVVVSIITVISAIGLVSFQTVRNNALEAKRKGDIDAIKKAYESNYDPTANGGQGGYKQLSPTQFSDNKIPTPDGTTGTSYLAVGPGDADTGTKSSTDPNTETNVTFRVCAPLDGSASCNKNEANKCECTESSTVSVSAVISQDPILSVCNESGNGLLAIWKFDEESGTTANEPITDRVNPPDTGSGGVNRNGTLSGIPLPSRVDGKFGKAILFNGSNFVAIPNSGYGPRDFSSIRPVQFPTDRFTVTFWVKPSHISGDSYVWGFGRDGGSGKIELLRTGGQWKVWSNIGQNPITGGVATANQWTFLTYVRNGANDKLYINDSQVGPVAGNNIRPFINEGSNTTALFRIGAGIYSVNRWNGLIDESRFYNKVLNLDQIRTLYGNGLGCPI